MANGRVIGKRRSVTCIGALILACALTACSSSRNGTGKTQDVTIDGRVFHLALALSDKARQHGLSDKKYIADDAGMLFVFPHTRVLQFWMKHCYVPIDVIFLDANGRAVRTYEMKVQPYNTPESDLAVYSSVYPAQFAIELQGGMLEHLHIQPGDKVGLPLTALKARAR